MLEYLSSSAPMDKYAQSWLTHYVMYLRSTRSNERRKPADIKTFLVILITKYYYRAIQNSYLLANCICPRMCLLITTKSVKSFFICEKNIFVAFPVWFYSMALVASFKFGFEPKIISTQMEEINCSHSTFI